MQGTSNNFQNGEITRLNPMSNLKEIIEAIKALSPEEKAHLIGKVMQENSFSVIFGNGSNHVLQADLVVQINDSDAQTMKTIVEAIARRIER
jgi:soluble P-type ATPase